MPRAFNQPGVYLNGNLAGFNGHIPGQNDIHQSYSQYEFGAQPGFQNTQNLNQSGSPARALRENGPQSNPLIGFRDLNLDSVVSKSPPTNTSNLPTVPIQSPWNGLSKTSTPEHIAKSDNVQPISASTIPHPAAPVPQPPWNQEAIFRIPAERKSSVLVEGSLETKTSTVWNSNATANNLTTGNLVQNNEQQEITKIAVKKGVSPIEHKVHSPEPSDPTPVSEISAAQSNQSSKALQKPALGPLTSPTATEAPVPPVIPKAAWAKEEEGKTKKAAVPSISLREIQEAEAKKLESRKAAEREKEKLARVSAVVETKEDTQPFTTSWGLPTSQAGSRASITPREVPTVPAQSPATIPVWTTPLKQPTIKKTMKEIQEEEEGRKKLAALKETSIPVPSKRGYAETTTKVRMSVFAFCSHAYIIVDCCPFAGVYFQ
jgi:PERQ amino acid-rich with GYF domain-containing protein